MGRGQEMMKQVQDALHGFEEAIVKREHKGMLEGKVPLQQEVDKARQHVVDVVVALVRTTETA